MTSTNTGRTIRLADIARLTGIGLATIACSRFSNHVDLVRSVLAFGAFELAYLWWVARGYAGADRRLVSLAFQPAFRQM